MSSGQARSIKITGDRLRKCFENQCTTQQGSIRGEFLIGLNSQNSDGSYILKAGKNWQFHLGSFSPFIESWGVQFINKGKSIKYDVSIASIIMEFRRESFLRKFMLKKNFLVVYEAPNWLIFDTSDLLALMQDPDQIQWRILESGRIKGDIFKGNSKRAVLTFEFRSELHKKQFVFGAHGGGAGELFKEFIKEKLFFNTIPVDYEQWQEYL